MSARVFNPLVLSEMRRMIGRSNSDASPAAVASVRRDLFGPINHEEAQSFVDRELAVIRKRDNEKWGFDFDKGLPLENSRFRWEPFDPEAYTLRLSSLVGQKKEEASTKDAPTNTTMTAVDPEDYALRLTSLVGQKKGEESTKDAPTNTTIINAEDQTSQKVKAAVKQSQITDFLKCRKRSLSVDDISRRKVGNFLDGDVSSTKVGTAASLSKPSKNKRSRTRQIQ